MFEDAVSAAGAASGAARISIDGGLPWGTSIVVRDIQLRLLEAKLERIRWHTFLNNHASTRPKEHGGQLCSSLKECTTIEETASGVVCRLVLPNSYARDDGLRVSAAALAATERAADEDVCFFVFAYLCAHNAGLSTMVFRPKHWNVPIQDLVHDIGRMVDSDPSATYEPLAVNQRAAASGAMAAAGELRNVSAADWERVADLIRLCLRAHDGSVDPSNIDHRKIVREGGRQAKVYDQLADLLPRGTLWHYVEQHPEFRLDEEGGVKRIQWQRPPAAASTPAGSASAASGAVCALVVSRGQQGNDNNSLTVAAPSCVPSTAASGALCDVAATTSESWLTRVFSPGDDFDRKDLSDFWRIGPGRFWQRPP